MPIEQDDPCVRARELRAVRDRLITGEGVVESEFSGGNGSSRRVRYTKADMTMLNSEIAAADAACARSRGQRPRRFAVRPRI